MTHTAVFSYLEPTGPIGTNTSALFSFFISNTFFLFLSPTFWIQARSLIGAINYLVRFSLFILSTKRKPELLGWDILLSPTFLLLVFLNLSGLIPYRFASTSYPIFTLPLAVTLWLTPILTFIWTNFIDYTSSLLPDSTPLWLAPFITIIELVRILLRPLTLAFRVTANITAGHLILTLISHLTFRLASISLIIAILILIVQRLYMLFEVAVCFLQAAIFCILLVQYTKAH